MIDLFSKTKQHAKCLAYYAGTIQRCDELMVLCARPKNTDSPRRLKCYP